MIKGSMTKTKEQLIIENEELHSRLVETEETLAAIRSGEVDAILVSGTKGEQVYSLSSAETPYRIFLEEMNEGAITLSKEGMIIYCNRRFAELVQEPSERVIGSYLKRLIAPKEKSKLDSLLSQQTHKNNDVLIISLINKLYLKLSFHLSPPYIEGENYILIATDVTIMKEKENELIELHNSIEKQLDIIQRLRMDLIDKQIDAKVEINKLKNTIKKLVKEITKHKMVEAELRQKQRSIQKKAAI
jgi:two-component system phosphate regulon sensor histidine kinase PhoR